VKSSVYKVNQTISGEQAGTETVESKNLSLCEHHHYLQPSLATYHSSVNLFVTGMKGGKNLLSKALTFMYI